MFKNKKYVGIIALVLVAVLGTTYAFFNYYMQGLNRELIAGDIYLNMDETGGYVTLTNVFPETVEEARARTDNTVTFTIDGRNSTTNKTIWYEIMLDEGDENSNYTTKIKAEHLRFDLTEIIDGVETLVVNNMSYNELNSTRIWVNQVDPNTSEVSRDYVLRVWIDENVLISDTDPNADYPANTWKNTYASVKVSVYGDFNEKVVGFPLTTTVKSKLGTDGVVAINTDGDLASEGDAIREYRYSGSGKYCTYTPSVTETSAEVQPTIYKLNVDGDTCPNACYVEVGILSSNNEVFTLMGGSCVDMGGTELTPNETAPLAGEVNNYVEFNGELWRIIGVFTEETSSSGVQPNDAPAHATQELVKIVKDTPISNDAHSDLTYTYNDVTFDLKPYMSGATLKYGYYHWNKNLYYGQTNLNDWTNATAQIYLNDENGVNSYYNSIDSQFQDMIQPVYYKLGNVNPYNLSAPGVYQQERNINGCSIVEPKASKNTNVFVKPIASDSTQGSCNIWSGNAYEWEGKIGLMYPSDYAYAASSNNWYTNLGDYYLADTTTGSQENWLNDSDRGAEWFISPSSRNSINVINVDYYGGVVNNSAYGYAALSPVLYLKSNVMTIGGDGKEDSPYILSLSSDVTER